jgi:hypothetical protein
MKWLRQKGIREGKPEEVLGTTSAENRQTIALLFQKDDLSKSGCLAEKRIGKHLFISV